MRNKFNSSTERSEHFRRVPNLRFTLSGKVSRSVIYGIVYRTSYFRLYSISPTNLCYVLTLMCFTLPKSAIWKGICNDLFAGDWYFIYSRKGGKSFCFSICYTPKENKTTTAAIFIVRVFLQLSPIRSFPTTLFPHRLPYPFSFWYLALALGCAIFAPSTVNSDLCLSI